MKTADETPVTGLADCVAAFLAERAVELSPYSVTHLRASLLPMTAALGDDAAVVTYAQLRAYVDGLHLRYKPGTIRPVVGDLRQFWRWAKRRGYVRTNPAKRLKMPSRRVVVESSEARAAPEDDVRRVLDHMASRLSHVVWRDLFGNLVPAPVDAWGYDERQTVRDLFVLSFLYETGARAGELWRLGSAAMESAAAAPGPVYCVASSGKTGSVVLRFTRATAELWSVWSGVRPAGCPYAVAGWKPNGPPTPLTTPGISKMLARQCERAGVVPFRAHALRHAKIRRGKATVGLETMSRLVGHGSAIITAGYGRADDDDLDAATLATGLSARLWS